MNAAQQLTHDYRNAAVDTIEVILEIVPPDLLERPCEIQLFGFFPKLDNSSVLLASALWNGEEFAHVTPRNRAYVLLHESRARNAKHYPYLVLRRTAKAIEAMTYIYALPPATVLEVTVVDEHDMIQLLQYEAQLPHHAEAFLTVQDVAARGARR